MHRNNVCSVPNPFLVGGLLRSSVDQSALWRGWRVCSGHCWKLLIERRQTIGTKFAIFNTQLGNAVATKSIPRNEQKSQLWAVTFYPLSLSTSQFMCQRFPKNKGTGLRYPELYI